MQNITISDLRKRDAAIRSSLEVMRNLSDLGPPVPFVENAYGIQTDPWQRQYLNSSVSHAAIAIVACRQTGKSTVTAGFVAWCMLRQRSFVALICSRSLRQAAEFIDKIKVALLSMVPRAFLVHSNSLGVLMRNQSRVLAVPCQGADAARGFSPDLLVVDEAAFVPDDVFVALTPSLNATHGALHMISSPNGRAGMFFEAVEGAVSDDYMSFRVRADDVDRFDPDFLRRQERMLGDLRYRQEYNAEFVTMIGAFFDVQTTSLVFRGEEIDEKDMGRADYVDIVNAEMSEIVESMESVKSREGWLYA